MNSALDPILDTMKSELENHILKMHLEDFSRWPHPGTLFIATLIQDVFPPPSPPSFTLLLLCSSSLSHDVTAVPDAPCSQYIRDLQVRSFDFGNFNSVLPSTYHSLSLDDNLLRRPSSYRSSYSTSKEVTCPCMNARSFSRRGKGLIFQWAFAPAIGKNNRKRHCSMWEFLKVLRCCCLFFMFCLFQTDALVLSSSGNVCTSRESAPTNRWRRKAQTSRWHGPGTPHIHAPIYEPLSDDAPESKTIESISYPKTNHCPSLWCFY